MAQAETHTARQVLAFWFRGAPFERLSDDAYIADMFATTWPGVGFEYELKRVGDLSNEAGWNIFDECEQFLPDMQAAARFRYGYTDEDDHAVLARVLLLDQMFSLLHRGQGDEYPFLTEQLVESCGDMARAEARRLIDDADPADVLPLAHIMFLVSPLLRSEDKDDHLAADRFVKRHSKAYHEKKSFASLVANMKQHLDVLTRFKRFPHRNKKCARKCTPHERAWLDGLDTEPKPSWADENFDNRFKRTVSGASTLFNHTVVTAAKVVAKQDDDIPDSPKTPKTKSKVSKAKKAPAGGGAAAAKPKAKAKAKAKPKAKAAK